MNLKQTKKKLEVFKILLSGINLIEASAGTGKTFTIVLLYLRSLLGIGKKKYQKKLLIHEILVLTFTNTAKEELYIRIKKAIDNLYIACINKTSKDPVCKLFLHEIENLDEAIDILKKAKNNIYNASIYTIHSFCQNILKFNTFYINYMIQYKIIDNEADLYLITIEDFWRLYLYNLPEDIIKIILGYYKNPKELLKEIKPFIHIDSKNFNNKLINHENVILLHQKNIETIKYFKKIWLINYHIILNIINNLKINKRIYNISNISRWIKKIETWAKSHTQDYCIPIELNYFTEENIKKNTTNYIKSEYMIFLEIEKIFRHNFSLKYIIIQYAIQKIKQLLIKEKKKQKLLGFNDLLSVILKMLKKEKYLRQLIQKKYPIAFIDEFQDTDIKQYQIFNILYKNQKKSALFLIGDPKQAIYSFRGADIFSYLYIKSKIKKYYYLDTNWRSSVDMCNGINILFLQNSNPFIFKNIPFMPIQTSDKNSKMKFLINGIPQKPIKFFLNKKKEIHLDEYQIWIAKQCAQEISYWLTYAKLGKATIITKKEEKMLSSNDIAILVKNKKEADIITKELNELNISSIYSSERRSIFKTFDAQELLWLLESILEPDNIKLLKQSISTHIIQEMFSKIKKQNNQTPYFLIEKLYEYRQIWKNIGIFHMIKSMILEFQENATLIKINLNYKKNLNFLHIAEILQKQWQYLETKISLIRWFQKKILEINEPLDDEYIRHFQQSESIKIITIYKSKGLEYPIVWIPFILDFNQSSLSIYHNKQNYKVIVDIQSNHDNLKNADEERLAEDIRFLYVAITRSIFHCCIGLFCLNKKKIKNRIHSDVHHSGIGHIIQNGKSMNHKDLLKKLNQLSLNNLLEVNNNKKIFALPKNLKYLYLTYKPIYFNQNNQNTWNITSFTKLKKENDFFSKNKSKILLNHFNITKKIKKNKKLTINNFPKGKNTGLMMHYILKNLHILNNKKKNWFSDVLHKYNIPSKWTKILIVWIKNIIHTPLDNNDMSLSKIKQKSCVQELEFFFPIKNTLYSTELNKVIQIFDPISSVAPKLFFNPTNGVLKGFIDLFFIWRNKYYIIDYKSNWLGDDNSFYSPNNIQKTIIENRYDFQYQIYTIAIHKYLKQKIKNYNYHSNFGGIFYFFLRAIGNKNENNGIFYTIPNYSLIKKTMDLIS